MNTHNTNHIGSYQPSLPTSRTAPEQERGVLAVLRSLAPRRHLSHREVYMLAELQANRLLELAGLPQAPIPNELITELPRIMVHRDPDLPVSGSAHWASGRWQLSVNASEPWTRQRFSLAHEFKHCIDHRHIAVLYTDASTAEAAADYFAACLLMPKRLVKRHWGEGTQSVSALARVFAVSPVAMARRLEHLGLRSLPSRPTSQRDFGRRGHYTRTFTTPSLGAAA